MHSDKGCRHGDREESAGKFLCNHLAGSQCFVLLIYPKRHVSEHVLLERSFRGCDKLCGVHRYAAGTGAIMDSGFMRFNCTSSIDTSIEICRPELMAAVAKRKE
jgi:hypothetical protein